MIGIEITFEQTRHVITREFFIFLTVLVSSDKTVTCSVTT